MGESGSSARPCQGIPQEAYPPSHPAVIESLRQIGEAIPALAALGTVEWKVGVTGLHWHGQHLLPRNAQIAELAGLLYARGVRTVTLNPGMTPDHVLTLFQVATGIAPPNDGALGRIALALGRRTAARLERLRPPTAGSGAPATQDRKSTRLNSSHSQISYAVFCLKKKKDKTKVSILQSAPANLHPLHASVQPIPPVPLELSRHRQKQLASCYTSTRSTVALHYTL